MPRTPSLLLLAPLLALSVACGDDSDATGAGGSSTSAAGTSTSTSGATTSGATTSAAASTTTGAGTGGAGGEGPGAGGSTSSVGGGGSGGGGTGGGALDCDALPLGPFEPVLFSDAFGGSEDIALDGLGHLAGKRGGDMLLVDAGGAETVLAGGIPGAFGTRYRSDGALVVALPGEGRVIAISPRGDVSELADGLNGPNGIHVTFDDVVWVTELPAGRIQRIAPGGEPELFLGGGDAPSVNGVYVDEGRAIVFFTNYAAGELWRVDQAGAEEPALVATIDGANLDGLTMDACGNVYAVDQGNGIVYRVRTDASGDRVGEVELIAEAPSGIANAQFGRGAGFPTTTLFAAGNPGDVFAIDVGVPGAPQAGPR